MSTAEKLARIFKVLSVGTRVRIVQLLRRRALCVNSLASKLDITPAAVSQHLRVLRDSGVVVADKRGSFVHYEMNVATLASWKNLTDGLLKPKLDLCAT